MIPNNQIVRRDAIIFVSFDQEINPKRSHQNNFGYGAKQTPADSSGNAEEIEKDSSVNYYVKQAQPNRWLAFRAVNSNGSTENALPGASTINVIIEKGTPSAEGPLTTASPRKVSTFKLSARSNFKKRFAAGNRTKTARRSSSGIWNLIIRLTPRVSAKN
jgi:hypothetical protein